MNNERNLEDKLAETFGILRGITATLEIILESFEYRNEMDENDKNLEYSLSIVTKEANELLEKVNIVMNDYEEYYIN